MPVAVVIVVVVVHGGLQNLPIDPCQKFRPDELWLGTPSVGGVRTFAKNRIKYKKGN